MQFVFATRTHAQQMKKSGDRRQLTKVTTVSSLVGDLAAVAAIIVGVAARLALALQLHTKAVDSASIVSTSMAFAEHDDRGDDLSCRSASTWYTTRHHTAWGHTRHGNPCAELVVGWTDQRVARQASCLRAA